MTGDRAGAIRGVVGLAVALVLAAPLSAEPFVPDPGAESYASVLFAGSDLTVAKDCQVTGDLHGNGPVTLQAGTVVDGNISAVGAVALNGATITGSVTSPVAPIPLPGLPTPEEARALADRAFEGDHSFPDGTVIDDVVFVAGAARFRGSVDGQGTVIAGGEIRFDNVTPNRPVLLDEATRMSFVSLGSLWVGMDRALRGGLVAAGPVEIHQGVDLEGLVVAGGTLAVSKDAVIRYLPFDRDPPVVTDLRPADRSTVLETTLEIGAAYTDEGSGVDPGSVRLLLDGIDRTEDAVVTAEEVAFTPAAPLAPGAHQVKLAVADLAGNLAEVAWGFTVQDLEPPTITIEQPEDGFLTNQAAVEVRGTVTDTSAVTSVLVNGASATLQGGTFSATVPLAEGFNDVLVEAIDSFRNRSSAAVGVTLDTVPPELILSSPADGVLVNGDSIRVAGEVTDGSGIERLTVDGTEVANPGGPFETEIQLQHEGPRTIVVAAVDLAGNSTQAGREVVRFSLPEVAITAPADLAFVAATTVEVSGVVSAGVTAVAVNGVPAALAGTSFLAQGVPLIEGGNTVTATATDGNGHVATATIHVVRDLTPPRVAIYRPEDGSVVRSGAVSVSGLVNDIVPGTVNASEATVTVNGTSAEVANRSFSLEDVALVPGENTLVATAVDESGNVGEARVTVVFEPGVGARVRAVSGDRQTGVIATTLPQPLVVEVLDAAGLPVPGTPVIFKVRENDGNLGGGERQIVVTAGADGRAQASFTLGTRAGVANQVVEASAVGFAGPAVFTASALPGEPALVVVDSGGLQVGVAGQQVPRPLIAAVVDAGNNRLPDVPVAFRVVEGSGHFAGGLQETVVPTDSDGRAIVSFNLDAAEGVSNNQVEARVQGLADSPSAIFVASGRAAGDPAGTSISGVVLDNTNVPIAGATLRVKHTALTSVTDEEGQFRIEGAPVGAVKLIVDGSTVQRPGTWPDLEFDLVTIAGRDNTVNMPIFLLPLDLDSALFVDETRSGTLTLPEVPGFALEIGPGSVTFPGGGRSGLVSVTVVHNDKVPMTPNFGQQPRLIVTIQPAGARFDPPARLILPNVESLAPGRVTEMYSFDHDLGHFVSIGPATVSDDGTLIVANPGVGIVKAGWHCGGDPATGVCLHQCPECRTCVDPPCRCDPDDSQTPTSITDDDGDCKKPACRNGLPARIPDPPDRPDPADARSNYCKTCDNQGNIVTDPARNFDRVPGTDCSTCIRGEAVDDNFDRDSSGKEIARACNFCEGEICVDGQCEVKGDPACSSACPENMCGTPCACMGGTGGMETNELSCWAVKEPDPANPAGTVFVCYRDYGVPDLPDHLPGVCCQGGCGPGEVTGQAWTIGIAPYRCTRAEPCTLQAASQCAGHVGF
jgi:cytoskeletal protein CcmA (bactofilin family)